MSTDKVQNFLEKQPDDSLAALLKRPEYSKRFEAVLGERAAQFASSLLSIGASLGRDVEPRSILGSAMIAAALDLPIDKNLGFAWIVPFRKDGKKMAQFQMGSRGYVQLALRSGQYTRMNSTPINKEVFVGWDDVGEPILDWAKYDPEGEIWGYFFGFQLVNGFVKKAVWTKEKIVEHAKRFSQAYRSDAAIWRDHFHGMAEKTVVANTLRKWGPLSIQMQRAITSDQAVIVDVDAEPNYVELDNAPTTPSLEHPEKIKQQSQAAAAGDVAVATPAATTKPADKTPPVEKPKAKETKTAPTPDNVVKMPAPEVKAPVSKTEEQELADAGLAPSAPAPLDPPPPVIVPATTSAEEISLPTPTEAAPPATAQEPAGVLQLSDDQAALKKAIEGAGYTFPELVAWGKGSVFPPNRVPTEWETVDPAKAKYFVTSIKGILAAIATWKRKQTK